MKTPLNPNAHPNQAASQLQLKSAHHVPHNGKVQPQSVTVRVHTEIVVIPRQQAEQRFGVERPGIGQKKSDAGQVSERAMRPIGDRIMRTRTGGRASVAEKTPSKVSEFSKVQDEEEGESPRHIRSMRMLDNLDKDNSQKQRDEIIRELEESFDPLQQYTELFSAMKAVDRRPKTDPDKKTELKNVLNEMLTDVVNRNRGGVRIGLRETAETAPVAAFLHGAQFGGALGVTLRDIRFGLGARAKGGIDEHLSPMVMAKAVLKNFGAALAEEAMAGLCSRLMSGLRNISAINTPAYQLTVADSVVFSIARTGFKIARDLRRDLADKTGVVSKLHHVEIGVVMFTAAEQGWGKGKGIQLVNQIVDLKTAEPLTRAKVYTAARDALNMLPPTAWPTEKFPSRKELLEDLDRQVLAAYSEIPLLTTKAERMEEKWRIEFAAGRSPVLPNRA